MCFFVGYKYGGGSYRVWDTCRGGVIKSRDEEGDQHLLQLLTEGQHRQWGATSSPAGPGMHEIRGMTYLLVLPEMQVRCHSAQALHACLASVKSYVLGCIGGMYDGGRGMKESHSCPGLLGIVGSRPAVCKSSNM
jgi:hypothetical protein